MKTILVVDDDKLNLSAARKVLSGEYKVIPVVRGTQVLSYLENEECDMILLDISMPEMDGFQVLSQLRNSRWFQQIPIVLITAENSESTALKGYTSGVSDIINKPFNPEIVHRRVENIIELYNHKRFLETKLQEQYRLLEKQAEKLKKANTFVIDTLSTAVEFRSSESGFHIARMRKITEFLLRALSARHEQYDFSEEEISMISDAAALHDIGKIAIPDEVLLKPGRLTPEEFEIMKTHTTKGCEILESLNYAQDEEYYRYSYEICRHHHERWDGKSYPDGLKGDEIPLSAQVVSLADVYDALVSDRVYRKALSHEKALSMIANGECGAFNPQLLESFFAVADILHEQLYAHPEVQEEEDIIKEKPVMSAIKPQEESNLSVRTLQLLERERKRYRCLSQMSGEILFDYDRETDTIEYTDRYCEIFGGTNVVLHAADAMKKSEHIDDADRRRIYAELEKLSPENPTLRSEVKLMTKYGSEEWFEIVLKAIFDEKEEYCDYIGKITNINRLKSESLHWKKQAFQDYLTGLYNRPALEDWMERQILQKPDAPFGLMILDIDYFKKVNDTGHENGDQLLKDTSGFLLHHLRSSDVVARIGGDEFAVIMQGVCSEEILNCKAVQIQNDFTSEFSAKYNANLSLSVGAACYPEQGATYHELMMKADQVLLQAKQNREPR